MELKYFIVFLLLVRFVLGGLFLFGLALVFEGGAGMGTAVFNNWPLFLINGLIFLGIGKMVWYESLRRLDISKVISIGHIFPLFSLVYLIFFFNEKISGYQWLGIIIMLSGLFFSIRRRSVDPKLTKYAPLD